LPAPNKNSLNTPPKIVAGYLPACAQVV